MYEISEEMAFVESQLQYLEDEQMSLDAAGLPPCPVVDAALLRLDGRWNELLEEVERRWRGILPRTPFDAEVQNES